jgi:two-component system chemotaxis sensor kinase CheA
MLSVSARQSGNQILIDIVDDGRGIDGKKLVEKAVAAARSTRRSRRAEPARAARADLRGRAVDRQAVTAISGRGVGMDVVRSNVERIGGIVEVDSTAGRGHAHDPARAADPDHHPGADRVDRQPAFRHSALGDRGDRPRQRRAVTLEHLGGAGVATIRGRRVPEVSLADVSASTAPMTTKERTLVVLKPAGGDVYALAVDRIHDHEELVVKPAAPAVMATGLYAGTTLADDGSPILLFDPAGLAEVGGVRLERRSAARVAEGARPPPSPKATPVLLFRGLDGARRALRLAVVDRIEEVPPSAIRPGAGQLRVQLGEAILPLAGAAPTPLRTARSACSASTTARMRSATPSRGHRPDAIDHDVIPPTNPGRRSAASR